MCALALNNYFYLMLFLLILLTLKFFDVLKVCFDWEKNVFQPLISFFFFSFFFKLKFTEPVNKQEIYYLVVVGKLKASSPLTSN